MENKTTQACPTPEWKPSELDVAVAEIYALIVVKDPPYPEAIQQKYIREILVSYASKRIRAGDLQSSASKPEE